MIYIIAGSVGGAAVIGGSSVIAIQALKKRPKVKIHFILAIIFKQNLILN